MTIRSTQLKVRYNQAQPRGGFTIKGSQAHSNLMARKFGNEHRAIVTLPKLKFLEKELDEED